jgi:hypothetical protein
MLLGFDTNLRLKNSLNGFRFENRCVRDCDRMLSNLPPKLKRDVRASIGILIEGAILNL